MNLSRNFTLAELTRTSTGLPNYPGPVIEASLGALCVGCLEPIREILGVPMHVNSGYRSATVNVAIGGAKGSQHMLGEACDFTAPSYPGNMRDAMTALVAAVKDGRLVVDQMIYYSSGFIHVSYRRGTNRNQLLRSAASGGSGGPYMAW